MNNDLISRSAVLEQECFMDDDNGFRCSVVLSADVRRAPAVDAVEVVRCKDCKLWDSDPDTYGNSVGPKGTCMKSFETMLCDDFCSYGERGG